MERRLLRLVEVQRLTTLGRTGIYELLAEDRFPRPVRLGPRPSSPVGFRCASRARGRCGHPPDRADGPVARRSATNLRPLGSHGRGR